MLIPDGVPSMTDPLRSPTAGRSAEDLGGHRGGRREAWEWRGEDHRLAKDLGLPGPGKRPHGCGTQPWCPGQGSHGILT